MSVEVDRGAHGSAVVALVAECSSRAASHLGYDLSTAWKSRARARLAEATT